VGGQNRIPGVRDEEKDQRTRPVLPRLALGALSGVLAGCAALAVAELAAAAVRPQAGPVVAVGGAAIDVTPAPVKDWAIRHFGTDDKLVLRLGILAVLAVLALALGVLATRFRRAGAAGVLLFGAVGAAAALSRPDARGITDALPSVVGALAGGLLLYVLVHRLTTVRRSPGAESGAAAGKETAGRTAGGSWWPPPPPRSPRRSWVPSDGR
jgi:hypothetical protein